VNIVLAQGFPGIASYMVRFNPQNVHNINLTQAIEGWSIICTALERKVFAKYKCSLLLAFFSLTFFLSAYEEAKMVHWAGTVHAILSGQKMRAQKEVSGMAMLLKLFAPAMNFFENVLAVSEHSDQRAEVAPFANFELFGMWSSLGLALKDQHPQKMEK
jgi:hypothetical protein